ncbi:MAG: hypothetical protein JXB23_02265 [Candidatus Aminicenantes bacterium]|nr:hypothetical protein [Candidatus Aminicenantes bacterium]
MILSTFWLVFFPIVLAPSSDSVLPASSQSIQTEKKAVCWWEVNLLLSSKGKYKYKQPRATYAGKYTYAFLWTGCLEQDQEDFILYHEDSDLLQWEPQEKKETPTGTKTVSAKDFLGKPCFELNYILTKGENLFFDFMVYGIKVPQFCSKKAVYLHFPASKEKANAPTDIDYDLYVYKGTNQVVIDKIMLLKDCTKKKFHWAWQHQKWFDIEKKDSYLFQAHEVDVEVSIIRHWEKRGGGNE